MIIKKINIFIFVFSALMLFFYFQSFAAEESEIDMTADKLEYYDESKYVVATGSVTAIWGNNQITAEKIEFYSDKEFIIATGSVTLHHPSGSLCGSNLTYDLKAKKGELHKAYGKFPPWAFFTRKLVKYGEEKHSLYFGKFTSCDLERPHYYISATKANIRPNKRITMYNCLFIWGGVPVLYLPAFTQGFGPHRDSIEIRPGYNNDDGFIMNIIYGYMLTDNSYAKLYLDYYSRRGLGKGLEYNFNVPNRMSGTFYGYHIKETTYQKDAANIEVATQKERWALRSAYWQKLDLLWTAQGEFNYNSDTTFNNNYFQDNWQRTTQELKSNISFTRQSTKSNVRFTVDRIDAFDQAQGVFIPNAITAPKAELTLYPSKSKKGLPFYTNFYASLQNQYTLAKDYYLLSSYMDTNIFNNYRLTRSLTYTPKLGLNESWNASTSKTDSTSVLTSRYYTVQGLRYRVAYWMDWDSAYSYTLRSKVNSAEIDSDANDFGEELKHLSFQNSIYANKVIIRNSTTYNLHQNRNEVVVQWTDKFTPLVNELTWIPNRSFYGYFREESNVYPNTLNSIQADMRYTHSNGDNTNLGAFYNSLRPEQLDLNVGFTIYPTNKWKLSYTFRTTASNKLTQFTFNDQELLLYRNIHCWQFQVRYRERQEYQEIFFQIDLTSSVDNRKRIYNVSQEKEFYPWRN